MTSDPLMARLREATAGQYEIVRELGRGGMAVVYLAYEIALDRHVAIKALNADPDGDEKAARRFLQEARTAARLSHPNVVRVYGVAPDGAPVRYFTMQYVDGCSLDDLLRVHGPLPVPVACHILAQVVGGLRYAHAHDRGGVVHRDVKPANVMLDSEGQVVLTDFGIARIAGADAPARDAELLGTPEYMSPEQWKDDESTPASDQYSLGAVAYRMLAGVPPFAGDAFAVVHGGSPRATPRPLRELRADCPPLLEAIVARMLERSPDARYASLDEVYRALLPLVPPADSVTELRELVARTASAPPPLVAPVALPARPARSGDAVVDPTMQLPPPRRRRARLAAVGGGLALAAAGVAVVVALGREPSPAAPRSVPPRDSTSAPPVAPAPPEAAPQIAEASEGAIELADSVVRTPAPVARPAPAPVARPARVQLLGLPADGRLRPGDSVRVRARVFDARGARVDVATVDLASSNPTHLAIRRHGGSSWAVARGAGGVVVTIIARSGPATARRAVSVVGRVAADAPRAESAGSRRSDSVARPREAAVAAALDTLLADLSARRRAAFEGVRPADGDAESARRFLAWAAGVKRLRVKGASREPPVFTRDGATVDFAVVLTWHRGLRRDPARTVRLRAAFVPEGSGWRLDGLQLREPFTSR